MNQDDFRRIISDQPLLVQPIYKAAARIPESASPRDVFGTPAEWATIVLMFPVVSFVIREIGLPWLYEAKRYSDLWRQKFHDWVTQQYQQQGLDPQQVAAAGEALRQELEKLTDTKSGQAWERFAQRFLPQPTDEPE